MRKALLFLLAYMVLLPFISNSQTTQYISLINSTNQSTINSCNVVLTDNGGAYSDYANSVNYWTAFCPSSTDERINIKFSEFNIHPSDRVEIYFGDGTT